MVNGIRHGILKIEKGVKQGDALSCVLFILCMEILLLNIKNNENIIPMKIGNLEFKTMIFADDTSPTVEEESSIQHVFDEYLKFSAMSGIRLNHSKTEILPIQERERPFEFKYGTSPLKLKPVNKLKIGGIWFGRDPDEIYNLNVKDKIPKLRNLLNRWSFGNFTTHGNVIISKTFGLSLFIHLMQVIHVDLEDLRDIERILYRIIWGGGGS